jgi:antirestriction protein ArdC
MAAKTPSWRRWRIENRALLAQYLDHWLAVMKADKKAIFTAASKASEAKHAPTRARRRCCEGQDDRLA